MCEGRRSKERKTWNVGPRTGQQEDRFVISEFCTLDAGMMPGHEITTRTHLVLETERVIPWSYDGSAVSFAISSTAEEMLTFVGSLLVVGRCNEVRRRLYGQYWHFSAPTRHALAAIERNPRLPTPRASRSGQRTRLNTVVLQRVAYKVDVLRK